MLFRATTAALLLAAQAYAANVITITQYPSVCSAVYTTGTKSFTVVQSTITVQPVPYNDTAYNSAQVPFVIETTPDGSTTRSWLTYDGTTTTNASLAGQYVIRNGGLFTLAGGQISANPGAGVQSFAPSSTVGSISTGFAFTNGILSWTNAAFPSGSIGFYSNGKDLIFSTNAQVPPGYYKVVVRAVSKSSIEGVASTGIMSVSTSIIVGSMSNSPPNYTPPGYPGPNSSSAPPFVYAPTASSSVAGPPPVGYSSPSAVASASTPLVPVISPSASTPPAPFISPSASTPPAPVVSPSASTPPAPVISPSASTTPSSSAAVSPPAASSSPAAPKSSSSSSSVGPPVGYSSPAASPSSSASSASSGLVLPTQSYQNTPIGPNNPIISTAVSSSAVTSSSASTSTSSAYVPSLPSELPIYLPTPSASSPAVSSSSVVASPSISLPAYSSPLVPVGPNNPTFAPTTSSSSSSAVASSSSSSLPASSSALPSLPNAYSSPSVIIPVTLPSSSAVVITTVLSSASATSSSSSSAAVQPPAYSSPDGASSSSSSSAAPVNPPAYSSPSSAAASSTGRSSSSSSIPAASSSSSSVQAPVAYPITTTTSSSSSSAAANTAIASGVPSCPSGDGTNFYDANGAVYSLYCNVESQAVSYTNSPAKGVQACLTLCDADANCVAATYAGSVGDGVCYLKATTGTIVSSPVQYFVKRSGPTNGIVASSSAASSSSSSAGAPPVYGQATTTTSTTAVSSSSSSAAAPAQPTTTTATTTTSTTRTTTSTTVTTTTSTTRTTTTTTSTSASPYLILPSPTPCDFGDPAGYPEDDSFCELDLPFAVQIYGASSKNTFASTNGYISILAGSSQYQVQPFPDTAIPNNTVAPYFDDLYLYENSYPQQGIWYQIQGTAVVWEYYLARAGAKGSIYHFTVAYDSTVPGTFRFKYYAVGTDSGDKGINGLYAGVGVQGLTAASSQYEQYSYQEAGSIKPGMVVTCSTSAGTCTAGGTSLITISIG